MLLLSRPMICSGQWSRTIANRRKLRLTPCGGRQSSVSPNESQKPRNGDRRYSVSLHGLGDDSVHENRGLAPSAWDLSPLRGLITKRAFDKRKKEIHFGNLKVPSDTSIDPTRDFHSVAVAAEISKSRPF